MFPQKLLEGNFLLQHNFEFRGAATADRAHERKQFAAVLNDLGPLPASSGVNVFRRVGHRPEGSDRCVTSFALDRRNQVPAQPWLSVAHRWQLDVFVKLQYRNLDADLRYPQYVAGTQRGGCPVSLPINSLKHR